jgi:hypothetical protein
MKRYLIKLAFFIPICLSLYFVLAGTWGFFNFKNDNILYPEAGYGFTLTRLQEADTTSNVDILIVGSSHAYRGFDTRLFRQSGYRAFNLGSSNQTHVQTQQLLNQYLNRLNPKLVLYEVYPGTLQNDGVESSLDLIANGPIDFYTIKMVFQVNHLKTYNTLFFALVKRLFQKRENLSEIQKRKVDQYIKGGYVQKKLTFNEEMNHSPFSFTIKSHQKNAFNQNIDLLKKNNINYLLTMAPITKSRYKMIKNKKELNNFFNKSGEYINFNKHQLPLNDTLHFYDTHHLNQKGVEIFNKELIEIIRTRYTLNQ